MSRGKKTASFVETARAAKGLIDVLRNKVDHVTYPSVSMMEKLRALWQNKAYWEIIRDGMYKLKARSGPFEESNKGQALYSSHADAGKHEYLYMASQLCANVNALLQDHMLMACYFIEIADFRGMVAPGEDLYLKFEAVKDNPKEHNRLVKESAELLKENTARIMKRVASGEPIPQGTRILLGANMVRVKGHGRDATSQWVEVETDGAHTFHPGSSLHRFCAHPTDPKRIQFINYGKGETPVPFFDKLNNLFACVLWTCSSRIGLQRYLEFAGRGLSKADLEKFDFKAFVEDTDNKFAEHLGKTLDPEIMDSLRCLAYLSEKVSPINLYVVDYFHHLAKGNEQRAAQVKADGIDHVVSMGKDAFKETFPAACDFVTRLPNEETARKFFEFVLGNGKDVNPVVDSAPPDDVPFKQNTDRTKRTGLFSRNFVIYGLGIATVLTMQDIALTQAENERLEKEVAKSTASRLTDQKLLQIRNEYNDTAITVIEDLNPADRNPDVIEEALSTSIELESLVSYEADSILDDFIDDVVDELKDTSKSLKERNPTMTIEELQVGVSEMIADVFGRELSPVFFGEGSFTEAWASNAMVNEYVGAEKKELMEKQQKEAIAQDHQAQAAFDEAKKKYESSTAENQEHREAELREAEDKVMETSERVDKAESRVKAATDKPHATTDTHAREQLEHLAGKGI